MHGGACAPRTNRVFFPYVRRRQAHADEGRTYSYALGRPQAIRRTMSNCILYSTTMVKNLLNVRRLADVLLDVS